MRTAQLAPAAVGVRRVAALPALAPSTRTPGGRWPTCNFSQGALAAALALLSPATRAHPHPLRQRVPLRLARRGHHRRQEPRPVRGALPQLDRRLQGARQGEGRRAEGVLAGLPLAPRGRHRRPQLLRAVQDRAELPRPRLRPRVLGAALRPAAVDRSSGRSRGTSPRRSTASTTSTSRSASPTATSSLLHLEEDVRQPAARRAPEEVAADERGHRRRARRSVLARRGGPRVPRSSRSARSSTCSGRRHQCAVRAGGPHRRAQPPPRQTGFAWS